MTDGREYAREGFDAFPSLYPDPTTWDKAGKRLRRKSVKLLKSGRYPLGFLLHGLAARAEGSSIPGPGPERPRRLKQLARLMEQVEADAHPIIATLAASERAGGQAHA